MKTVLGGSAVVEGADLDGDGDLDILSASSPANQLVWYENLGGNRCFSDGSVITSNVEPAFISVFSADADGDNDVDVFLASRSDGKVTWLENTDGKGAFDNETTLFDGRLAGAQIAAGGDFDNDGDVDLIVSAFDGVMKFENADGRGGFSHPEVLSQRVGKLGPAADIDGDGYLDLVTIGPGVSWYANIDGEGNFGDAITIWPDSGFTGIVELDHVTMGDVDNDGDIDVLTGSENGGSLVWYENTDATGTLWNRRVFGGTAGALHFLTADDLDADGRMDVLSSSPFTGGRIGWYENRIAGDSNNDGRFDSSDLAKVFQEGLYEDDVPRNATFDQGDWNGDGDFDSGDLVFAFQAGTFVAAAQPANLAAAAIDFLFADDYSSRKRVADQ